MGYSDIMKNGYVWILTSTKRSAENFLFSVILFYGVCSEYLNNRRILASSTNGENKSGKNTAKSFSKYQQI